MRSGGGDGRPKSDRGLGGARLAGRPRSVRVGLLAVAAVAGFLLAGMLGSAGQAERIYLPIAPRNVALTAAPAPSTSPTAAPSASPTSGPGGTPTATAGGTGEWTQDGHDAQRTGYTAEEPVTPWTLRWSWNGPDASGGAGGHLYDAPPEARTVTGGANVYAPAGSRGLYALSKATGQPTWNVGEAAFNAAPAYDPASASVIAGGADGRLYKLDAASGRVLQTYAAGAPINKAVLLAGGFAYAASEAGDLHKVAIGTFAGAWVYRAGSRAATPPAFSAARGLVVFATDDLAVHAVADPTGARAWRVTPSPNPPGFPFTFERGWPVVAERHGLVLLRMQLAHAFLADYPGPGGIYPNSNAATRAFLQARPDHQNLFALRLADGSAAFLPAVGYGSTEDYLSPCPDDASRSACPYGVMGSQPVVRALADGGEVAYIHFRNGQSNPPDYRWDGHMGEMVLDDATVPGLAPGDLRFVRFSRRNGYGGPGYTDIVDEQNPITGAGDSLFHAHWGASEGVRLTDRSAGRGLSYASPIETLRHPTVIRQQQACASYDPVTHWTTCGLTMYQDLRFWDGPGFWTYWNAVAPPGSPQGSAAYSAGFLPRYTYVSDGLLVVEGNGGELMAFGHSGRSVGDQTRSAKATSMTTEASSFSPRARQSR